jgi:hypothetical protein
MQPCCRGVSHYRPSELYLSWYSLNSSNSSLTWFGQYQAISANPPRSVPHASFPRCSSLLFPGDLYTHTQLLKCSHYCLKNPSLTECTSTAILIQPWTKRIVIAKSLARLLRPRFIHSHPSTTTEFSDTHCMLAEKLQLKRGRGV